MSRKITVPGWVVRVAVAAFLLLLGAMPFFYVFKIGASRRLLVVLYLLVAAALLFLFAYRGAAKSVQGGVFLAFFVSFAVEMYGFLYSVYFLTLALDGEPLAAPWLPWAEDRFTFWQASSLLLVSWYSGLTLVMVGWRTMWKKRGILVTSGIYSFMRHPQYLGLDIIVVGFLLWFTTPAVLVLGCVILFANFALARREDRTLAARHGAEFEAYKRRVGAFCPRIRRRSGTET